jgi:hypothetical protein
MEHESIAKILLYIRSKWSIHNLEPATAVKNVVSLPLPTIPLSFPQLRIWWCTQVAVAHDTQGLACIPAKMNTDHMIMWPTENRVALRVATATVSLDM